MFLIPILIYSVIQLYLFLKARGFVTKVIPKRFRLPGKIALYLFFGWVNISLLYIMTNGRHYLDQPAWTMYFFGYPFFMWMLASLTLLFLYVVKDWLVLLWRLSIKIWKSTRKRINNVSDAKPVKVNESRRKFLQYASASIAIPPIASSCYGVIQGMREYYVNEFETHFPNLPENLRGLKIAQLSDIHCSRHTTKEDIDAAVNIVNSKNADIVTLTGDFVPGEESFIYPCTEALKELKAKYGVFASQGNHDIWTNKRLIRKTLEENGIPMLINEGKTLDVNGEKLNLLGVDDSWVGNANLFTALQDVEPGHFQILMSHQPPFWDSAQSQGIDLTLAGHTHGGQIGYELLNFGINFGQFFHKYNKGLFGNNGKKLYVNQGIGFTFLPIRLNTPPEITIITLT